MTGFFEIFSNGARYAREQRDYEKVHVVQARRGGRGPRPLDLDSGSILLVHPGQQAGRDDDGPTLHAATPAQGPRLARLAVRAWLDASDLHHTDPRLDEVRTLAQPDPSRRVLVLRDETANLGVAAWSGADGTARLLLLAVDPGQQRHGFGSLLLAAVADEARQNGHHELLATTEDWMSDARHLLRQRGFQRIDASIDVEPTDFERTTVERAGREHGGPGTSHVDATQPHGRQHHSLDLGASPVAS